MNKFVRTKSPTGSKISKIFLETLCAGWTVVVHLCCGFSLRRQMAPQESAKFRTAFFGQFRTSLREDIVANYASIWTTFTTSVKGTRYTLQRSKQLADPSVGGAIRLAKLLSKFCKA